MPNAFHLDDPRAPIGGHRFGASGARITGAAALDPHLEGGCRAAITICVGTGQGIATTVAAK